MVLTYKTNKLIILARQNQKEIMNPILVIITYIYLSMLILNGHFISSKIIIIKSMFVCPISNMLSDKIFTKHRFKS